ncbi:hypothetical protein [Nocardiopsis halotolerans]|uniref:hypothetical protein n=1 Tax=Nocardiopsis halotolerans TaxID=124252 RepID=UPI001360B309|nr:hypothetical protein [Nocardiopsis halotolerans]
MLAELVLWLLFLVLIVKEAKISPRAKNAVITFGYQQTITDPDPNLMLIRPGSGGSFNTPESDIDPSDTPLLINTHPLHKKVATIVLSRLHDACRIYVHKYLHEPKREPRKPREYKDGITRLDQPSIRIIPPSCTAGLPREYLRLVHPAQGFSVRGELGQGRLQVIHVFGSDDFGQSQ